MFGVAGVGLILFFLVSLIPSIAVGVRRLHDTDRSGWWYLIGFIPYIGALILLIFFVLPGSAGYNRFGPPPGRSTFAQRAQYWGPGRPEALRKFAEDAQRAAASGYYPVWQDWRMSPAGEVLEVVYDLAPPQYGWGQAGYGQQTPYHEGPTAYPPGGTWYQGGPAQQASDTAASQPPSPSQPPEWR